MAETTTTSVTSFWETYNSDESFLPLYLPLVLWVSMYVYCLRKGIEFHRWVMLHNVHNVGAILLGLVSLYFDDDTVFNERVPILWSIGYFIVDLFDCATRLDGTYFLHAAFCLALGTGNYVTPVCRQLRMNSKATLCECSNPFLHLAKRTRNPLHFLLFAIIFTICRIIWLPILMRQLRADGMEWTNVLMLCLIAFYGLNLVWYAKILRILWDGLLGSKTEEDKKKKTS